MVPIRDCRGFSIVELAVVVSIMSMIGSIAMPTFQRLTLNTRAAAAANDLRVFAAAFQTQAQQAGGFPPEAGIGVMPPLMRGALGDTAWLRVTPVKGYYDWDYNRSHRGTRYRAAIGIRTKGANRVSNDQRQLVAIDRKLDDGNLSTGNFFLGSGNEPIFIIER
jgi:prepilin-type N-terminal cleavage/methylation domain-containing protein